MVNENTILDITFLSNLQLLKYNMQDLEQKKREIHLLVIKENWLSGVADRARPAWHGHGFHTGPNNMKCVTCYSAADQKAHIMIMLFTCEEI